MSGNLYQLRFKYKIPVGRNVDIDGPRDVIPYDRYGYVVAIKDTNEHGTLHLIRGTGHRQKRN